MSDDLENVFPTDGEPVQEVVQEPVKEPEPQAETPEAPVEAPAESQAPEAVAEPARPDPGYVPISAMMDERDRRKAAEARALELEQRQPQQVQRIDPFDDPEAFVAQQQQQVANQVAELRFQMSDQMAREKHGPETVDTAIAWAGERAKSDPVFAASYMRDPNPINWIVQQHKRHGVIEQIGDRTLDDFVKDYVAKNPNLLAAPVVAASAAIPQQASAPVRVPRSLATQGSSPSDIRDIAAGPLAGVDAVFTQ